MSAGPNAFYDALEKAGVEYSAMSWNGYNVFGDHASMNEFKQLHHSAGTVPALRARIADLEQQIQNCPPVSESEYVRRVEDEVARLRTALQAIRDHWACQYDHPRKQGQMYEGPYGTGVTDGHRCAAGIARSALSVAHENDA